MALPGFCIAGLNYISGMKKLDERYGYVASALRSGGVENSN
jgi:hypothetical protein